ncbi:MAG: hypothetical protein VKJ85_05795 [Prochlorothrix sp.]|nr:hypothetical protein [Prochlorothrix sp.]
MKHHQTSHPSPRRRLGIVADDPVPHPWRFRHFSPDRQPDWHIASPRRGAVPARPGQADPGRAYKNGPVAIGRVWRGACLGVLGFLAPPLTTIGVAQTVVSDGTLNTPTIVQESGGSPNLWTITGGTPNANGNFLFHSFLVFTLGLDDTALFDNAPAVDHIFPCDRNRCLWPAWNPENQPPGEPVFPQSQWH